KSLLQFAPALALAPLARIPSLREKLLLLLPAVALIAAVVLRANMSSEAVIGHSQLHVRYLLPGIPLLMILALSAIQGLRITPPRVLITAQLAAVLGVLFASADNDRSWLRRQLLLIVPLILVAVTTAWIALRRRWPKALPWRAAAWPALLLFAWGVAVNIGVDFRHHVRRARALQAGNDQMAEQLPGRLGVVGWPRRLNPFLALKDGRDIRYADLSELDDWRRVVRVVDHWQTEDRPVFMLLPRWHRGDSPWPGYRFRRVSGTKRLVQLIRDVDRRKLNDNRSIVD
ncbi:MAG: hypothetical protein JRF63_07705, partial [Deltaproteobacteria bacterium]|nr:hypothetical protein [Deltaproteobacteria bacterium]